MAAEIMEPESDAEAEVTTLAVRRDPPPPRIVLTKEMVRLETEQHKLLGEYIAQNMVEGTDFGVIPGTGTKKSLLKPGAEKLTNLFECTAKFTFDSKVEDWESGFFHYSIRCRIVNRNSDCLLAEGVGSANSRETKWRYRNAELVCPNCGLPAVIKGKAEFGGGYVCFWRKGGCGAKYDDKDPKITSQAKGKVDNPDIADQVNTILKIAKKRAHVDAAITLARCSDMFTQDVEDQVHDDHGHDDRPPARQQQRPQAPPKSNPSAQPRQQQQRPPQQQDDKPDRAVVERLQFEISAANMPQALATISRKIAAAVQSGELTPGGRDHLRQVYDARKELITPPSPPTSAKTARPPAADPSAKWKPAPEAPDYHLVKQFHGLIYESKNKAELGDVGLQIQARGNELSDSSKQYLNHHYQHRYMKIPDAVPA